MEWWSDGVMKLSIIAVLVASLRHYSITPVGVSGLIPSAG
jgi:hypothetical protein